MAGDVVVREVRGPDIAPWLTDIARLRVAVFRGFPYLYDGDATYERQYLEAFSRARDAFVVVVQEGDRVVGASTALPLSQAEAAYRAPFAAQGVDVSRGVYFGESVLLPGYRGRGLGHRFFDARERFAASLPGVGFTCFASVVRTDDDPRRPRGYRPHDAFWRGRGYAPQPDMTVHMPWREVGNARETEQVLTLWQRALQVPA